MFVRPVLGPAVDHRLRVAAPLDAAGRLRAIGRHRRFWSCRWHCKASLLETKRLQTVVISGGVVVVRRARWGCGGSGGVAVGWRWHDRGSHWSSKDDQLCSWNLCPNGQAQRRNRVCCETNGANRNCTLDARIRKIHRRHTILRLVGAGSAHVSQLWMLHNCQRAVC